jgi:hypothetical protein
LHGPLKSSATAAEFNNRFSRFPHNKNKALNLMRINDMKKINRLLGNAVLGLVVLSFACSVMAAEANEDEKKKNCKKPKFYDFVPKHLSEVAPESEISFKVARAKSSEEVHLEVKKVPVPLTAENKDLFYMMKGKLPDSLRGTYARLNVRAIGDGGCHAEDGWLLKISE